MLFPTIQFAIFFVVVLTANWLLLPHRRQWKLFMLGASWFFYGSWNWRFVFLIIASTLLNQAAAVLLDRSRDGRSRRLVLAGVAPAHPGTIHRVKYHGVSAP